jgi:hypothetical protein
MRSILGKWSDICTRKICDKRYARHLESLEVSLRLGCQCNRASDAEYSEQYGQFLRIKSIYDQAHFAFSLLLHSQEFQSPRVECLLVICCLVLVHLILRYP